METRICLECSRVYRPATPIWQEYPLHYRAVHLRGSAAELLLRPRLETLANDLAWLEPSQAVDSDASPPDWREQLHSWALIRKQQGRPSLNDGIYVCLGSPPFQSSKYYNVRSEVKCNLEHALATSGSP